ncbi:hypothetical protein GUJ93_ZPchr0013g34371 [Zizania palustris]|uniref:Uncharacterized protein n=1 Tax=Zizania palustris TaxID=103762 RepID=A0A8J5X4Y7_ZIZPA|nr:hypothetical protein GUJ93_ZPchr0013g34371 [Zizania palustris]
MGIGYVLGIVGVVLLAHATYGTIQCTSLAHADFLRLVSLVVASAEQVLPKEAAKGNSDFDVVKLDAAELLVKHVYNCCKSSESFCIYDLVKSLAHLTDNFEE